MQCPAPRRLDTSLGLSLSTGTRLARNYLLVERGYVFSFGASSDLLGYVPVAVSYRYEV
jgi:hypothetical protein